MSNRIKVTNAPDQSIDAVNIQAQTVSVLNVTEPSIIRIANPRDQKIKLVNADSDQKAIVDPFLAPATTLTLGGVIVGTGLSIDKKGTLSINNEYLKTTLEIDTYLKKDLSILPDADLTKRNSQLYIYENGNPKKTTIANLIDKKIRTVSNTPTDLITGDYIFREV